MFDKTAITALQESASIAQARESLENAHLNEKLLTLPSDFKVHDLEHHYPTRRRARGVMATQCLDDFATYAKAHAEGGATVFVDADKMVATAVLNLGDGDLPGHADNLAKMRLQPTAAYTALKEHTSGPLTQLKAAEFLEDWAGNVKAFNEQGELLPNKAIGAIRKLSIEAMRKLESSEQSLSASRSAFESVQATSADPIPTTIYFECEPYYGLQSRTFVIRLGVLTGGDKPAINLRIVKQELHDEEMANEFADKAREAIGQDMPVLLGVYAKS